MKYATLLLILIILLSGGCKKGKKAPKQEHTSETKTAEKHEAPSKPEAKEAPKEEHGKDSKEANSEAAHEKPAPAAPLIPLANRPVIVAFGDSLTAGYGADPGKSYPDFLQKILDKEGFQYRIVNAGVSGNTTKDGIDRLKDVLALKPQIVIVAFGGNDGLRGLPIRDTQENLDKIITTLKESGTKVVLAGISLPPNYGADYVNQFRYIYVKEAKKHQLPWLPFMLHDVYGYPGRMQADGIHPTAEGNTQVAWNIYPLIKPFLKNK